MFEKVKSDEILNDFITNGKWIYTRGFIPIIKINAKKIIQ